MNGRAYHSSRSAIIALLLGSGALSRAEIARRTGLSRATISLAMAELLSERLVQEVGTIASTGGRRATLVRLGGEARFVIGVAVEERSGVAALINLDGEVVATCGVALPAPGDPGSVVECVAEAVTMLARERDPGAVLAAGISLSGQANARERTFTSGVWKFEGIPLQALLRAKLGLPVELHDNAHAAALGELWRRGREHREHLVYFYMGVGVGGAIVAERALYTGTNQAAGEIGAVILDPNGLVFPCHQGCFEGYVSYANLRREIAERRAAGVVTALPDVLADDAILDLLDGAAGAGDPLALEILDYAARFAGQMAANLTNILNPDEIIIGGPYGQLGEQFATLVAAHASRTALPASFASVRILPGSPVTETAALGAGAAALALAPRLLA